MENQKIKVGITHGDINGIGYEVITKTLQEAQLLEICTPVIYGSSKVASFHRKMLGIDNFSLNIIKSAADANYKRVNIVNISDEEIKVDIGTSTKTAGDAALVALEKAVGELKNGFIDVLLTAPINKENIQSNRFHFAGHTEFLEINFGKKDDALMLMVGGELRIALATTHLPIAEVAQALNKELILKKLRQLHRSLVRDFSINLPRIAVLGLNPHAGDNGVIGTEEQEIIIPAMQQAEKDGIVCIGPYPADGFFGSGNYTKFDAILTMYHDQAMIPFKLLSMESGVNYTAGLSIVRTSPAHGTAYDIAGKNVASEESFRNALYLACDIFKSRKDYAEFSANQLVSNSTHGRDN
jgi:4-hydroxythreonine-4-phosphate dehydrogenase